jgi:hypothetical protein
MASPWIRRAFTTFFKTFGPKDAITISAYETLKAIEVNIDSNLEHVRYEDLPGIILQLEQEKAQK